MALLSLGDQTVYGTVEAMGTRDGERFYMMVDKHGVVTLMPADMMEEE